MAEEGRTPGDAEDAQLKRTEHPLIQEEAEDLKRVPEDLTAPKPTEEPKKKS